MGDLSDEVSLRVFRSSAFSALLKSPATIFRVPFLMFVASLLCSHLIRSFIMASPGPSFVSAPDMP